MVPILTLPESLIDRAPALSIGAAKTIDAVNTDDWRDFAMAAGYAPRFVLARVNAVAKLVAEGVEEVANELIDQRAEAKRMQAAAAAIRANSEQTLCASGKG